MARKIHDYFCSVADARFVMRKVVRIVDEIAKQRRLDPLEHQTLIQVFGAKGEVLVRTVAERLDVSPAFASKLVKALVAKGLVSSHASPTDLRVSLLRATAAGERLLEEIDAEVRRQVNVFTRALTPENRTAALAIFAFYVGAQIEVTDYIDVGGVPVPSTRRARAR
jgi:DNA-binding MarR family transcriptional regulator